VLNKLNKKGSYAKERALMQKDFPSAFFPRLLAKDLDQGLQSPTEGIQWLGVTGGKQSPLLPSFFCLPSSALCLLQQCAQILAEQLRALGIAPDTLT
jgi:hypothetical protein